MASIGRTPALRLAGWLVKTPRVALAAVLWMFVIEAAGGLAAWVILTVVIAGTLASVVAEPVMVRVLWWAWRPAPVGVPGVPGERVLVTGRPRRTGSLRRAARGGTRPSNCTTSGRPTSAPATIRCRRPASSIPDVRWLSRSRCPGRSSPGSATEPLKEGHGPVRFAWKVGLVVTGIASWQSVAAGRYAAAVGVVVVIGLTYLLPWTLRHQARLVDQALAGARDVPGVTDRAAAPQPPVPARTATAAAATARRPATHGPRDYHSGGQVIPRDFTTRDVPRRRPHGQLRRQRRLDQRPHHRVLQQARLARGPVRRVVVRPRRSRCLERPVAI